MHNNKINLLKALAILAVVSGHLEFSIIPMFPPYSFQVILFFFIAGMVFNNKYGFFEFLKREQNPLWCHIVCMHFLSWFDYFNYALNPGNSKFMPVTLQNEFLMPFLTGHQIDLISPLWFVPQLFISLIVYKIFSYIKCNEVFKTSVFLLLTLAAIQLQPLREKFIHSFNYKNNVFTTFYSPWIFIQKQG